MEPTIYPSNVAYHERCQRVFYVASFDHYETEKKRTSNITWHWVFLAKKTLNKIRCVSIMALYLDSLVENNKVFSC